MEGASSSTIELLLFSSATIINAITLFLCWCTQFLACVKERKDRKTEC
jgi:hypothetical protein